MLESNETRWPPRQAFSDYVLSVILGVCFLPSQSWRKRSFTMQALHNVKIYHIAFAFWHLLIFYVSPAQKWKKVGIRGTFLTLRSEYVSFPRKAFRPCSPTWYEHRKWNIFLSLCWQNVKKNLPRLLCVTKVSWPRVTPLHGDNLFSQSALGRQIDFCKLVSSLWFSCNSTHSAISNAPNERCLSITC